jgi:hypothetical protein
MRRPSRLLAGYVDDMAMAEVVTRIRIDGGVRVKQLVCHPTLPLVAGLDSDRPAVHVWEFRAGELHERGTIGGDSAAYADTPSWEQRPPSAAWHPDEPLLLVTSEGAVVRWTPEGLSRMDGLPPAAGYRCVAFSPDGQTLWAWPSPEAMENEFDHCCDAIDLGSGRVRTGRGWDTGVSVHPGGGLAATLRSNQGSTLGVFARVDQESTPAVMRVLSRAVILDCDGYTTPVFSADGRHFAIRGNAYGQFLEVFEFPSLSRVLYTTLGDPRPPGYPPPEEWREQMRAWSDHNIAFGAQPGVLWVGTPAGSLIEVDLDNQHAVEHDVLTGSRVTALCATAAGDLVAATGDGDLAVISVTADSVTGAADGRSAQALVAAFLDTSSEVPDDIVFLHKHLTVTSGERTWEPDDLESVTTATETDPTWLQISAAVNNLRAQEK